MTVLLSRSFRISNLRSVIGASLVFVLLLFGVMFSPRLAEASSTPSTCAFDQLEVAVGTISGAYSAAGSRGIPFIIVNKSKVACDLFGYPKLRFFPRVYQGKSIRITRQNGMIFKEVKPRSVDIRPGETASFGLNFGDASNQQDPSGGACSVRQINVVLPLNRNPLNLGFETMANFNFCYSGFVVSVTSIQAGPAPHSG